MNHASLARVAALALWVCFIGPACADASSRVEALHVLNRIGYGPVPGDIDRVQRIGIDRYIDEQLHPERLPLPTSLEQQLASLHAPYLSQSELIAQYREAGQAARSNGSEGQAMRLELLQRLSLESGEERLWRAVKSPQQLQEVMVDFWFNHFNVFSGKGLDRVLVENYEREAIRPHAMGRFRDLLGATAHHPAMLFYLDNWLSAAPGYTRPYPSTAPLGRSAGLNENYARELMELHTLGVDGGYTQGDVTALARMLTGWTFNPRGQKGHPVFAFDARRHDNSDKEWLGRRVVGGGQAEGEWALDVLAMHPATAHRIAQKLAQYFVADEPPPALVERLSRRFLDTGGDITAVLKTLFDSREFRDPQVHGAKFKTPYRYVVSAVRASDLPMTNVRPMLAELHQLGMPLYGCQTPDGYKNTEEAWLNPDSVTRRINFANALASGKLPLARPIGADERSGARLKALQRSENHGEASRIDATWTTVPVDPTALLSTLDGSLSASTLSVVGQAEPALRAALVLGSPDFMRH